MKSAAKLVESISTGQPSFQQQSGRLRAAKPIATESLENLLGYLRTDSFESERGMTPSVLSTSSQYSVRTQETDPIIIDHSCLKRRKDLNIQDQYFKNGVVKKGANRRSCVYV